MVYKILFSNIGYARGIDGSLAAHIRNIPYHLYMPVDIQRRVLAQLKDIILREDPDMACFVEIDRGSLYSARFNQLEAILDDNYRFHNIADKYGENSYWSRLPLLDGKSNAFVSKSERPFEKLYFQSGTKRLIYKILLPGDITLFFAHFSLSRETRALQMAEMRSLISQVTGEVMILADFNIMRGFSELAPLMEGRALRILNDESQPTFSFHRNRHVLDLCLCSAALAPRTTLSIIPQPFSDHAALLVSVEQDPSA